MTAMSKLTAIAQKHGGLIETKIASEHGVSKATLSKLCKENKLQRIVRGQYLLPDDLQDELLSISKRSQKLIFSHETALFLHGISDRTPFEHSITTPSNCIPSPSIKAECKVYYIAPDLFELGKTTLRTPAGNLVPTYNLERTICDIIRSRNKLGMETLIFALKQFSSSSTKDLNRLSAYANKLHVTNLLRPYLEVLL
jgi:predicted transcriptional regulator of viral defense system